MDRRGHNIVRRIGHGHRPAKMPHGLCLECAKLLTAKPLRRLVIRHVHGIHGGNIGQEMPDEQQESPNQTESLNNTILHLIVFALGKAAINNVAIVRLQADVKESQKGKNLINHILTIRIVQACGQEHILYRLQEFHGKKEEYTRSQLCVVRSTHWEKKEGQFGSKES